MIEEVGSLRCALIICLRVGDSSCNQKERKKRRWSCWKVLRIWWQKVEGILYVMVLLALGNTSFA